MDKIEKLKKFYYSQTDDISFLKEIVKEKREKALEKNEIIAVNYSDIIEATKKLLEELGLSDQLSSFYAYIYLLYKGYFSENNKFNYSSKIPNCGKYYGLYRLWGTLIITGRGNCLNISSMLCDLLENQGNESFLVGTSAHISIYPKFIREIFVKDKKYLELFGKVVDKHSDVLVSLGDTFYLFDPTNKEIFEINEFITANKVTNNLFLKEYIKFSPGKFLILNDMTIDEIITVVSSYQRFDLAPEHYTVNGIRECRDNTREIMSSNLPLIEDFYISTQPQRSRILDSFKKI